MTGKKNTKWLETMIAKHGSQEALTEYMKSLGRIGGERGTGHKFGHGKVNPSEASKKSWVSRRAKRDDNA